jgi:hypothetical protein
MAAAPQLTPLEVYLGTDFEPDAEFADGVIEERPVGENEHSAWQQALAVRFGQHARNGKSVCGSAGHAGSIWPQSKNPSINRP